VASRHGTRGRYKAGCRCTDCQRAQAVYQREYRGRVADGAVRPRPPSVALVGPLPPTAAGPVELAVQAELDGLAAARSRPGVAAAAVVMGRVLDSHANSSKPSAARVLTRLLDELHKRSDLRKSRLTVVRKMTERGSERNRPCTPLTA
jgi:hypothetical protein